MLGKLVSNRACGRFIIPRLPSHYVQELNVRTVYISKKNCLIDSAFLEYKRKNTFAKTLRFALDCGVADSLSLLQTMIFPDSP